MTNWSDAAWILAAKAAGATATAFARPYQHQNAPKWRYGYSLDQAREN